MQANRVVRESHIAAGDLSAQENDPDDHGTHGFQRITLRWIDDYLLSPGQQTQHNDVIIFMLLSRLESHIVRQCL